MVTTNSIKISNSDTKTWVCKRKFYYAYNYGITAKNQGMSISKGVFGHKLLETWYKELNIKAVEREYESLIKTIEPNNEFAFKDALSIYSLVIDYIQYYYAGNPNNVPKIIEVEKEFELDLEPYIGYPMIFKFKPDLIWEDPMTGKMVVVDNKFVYDFYRPNQLALDTQIPKYITALTLLDYDIHYGVINQLRTRNVKGPAGDKYNRELLFPNKDQYYSIWTDHMTVAKEIADWFQTPPKKQEDISPRVYSPMICRMCSYSDLCVAELKGNESEAKNIIDEQMTSYKYGQATLDILRKDSDDG